MSGRFARACVEQQIAQSESGSGEMLVRRISQRDDAERNAGQIRRRCLQRVVETRRADARIALAVRGYGAYHLRLVGQSRRIDFAQVADRRPKADLGQRLGDFVARLSGRSSFGSDEDQHVGIRR